VSNQVFDLAAWISPKNKVMRAAVKVRAFELCRAEAVDFFDAGFDSGDASERKE
jgi:hypothetical protein